ncbi:MAG: hypothetical protein AAFR17_00295 [Pseudomonadota bacterium]
MSRRHILFLLPLIALALIAGLQVLPSAEATAWRRLSADLTFGSQPPDFLAGGYWTRSGEGAQCEGYWTRYLPGTKLARYGAAPVERPALYRSAEDFFEIRSGPASEFLKRAGDRLIVYKTGFSHPSPGLSGPILQRRCEGP